MSLKLHNLGYIVPGASREDGARGVARFVEKPDSDLVRKLLASGAVWNSFIFAAAAATLLELLRESIPRIVDDMSFALTADARHTDGLALHNLYAKLPSVDFSRSVLEGAESRLRLIIVPACGWTDLGTPSRVVAALGSDPTIGIRLQHFTVPASLNLAEQCKSAEVRGVQTTDESLLASLRSLSASAPANHPADVSRQSL
ncbi:MAG: sugar phosphate nucleotidyltransferase [Steroidobacteraceae bacterium]